MFHSLKPETLIEMFYRNGTFNNDEWRCSVSACKNEYLTKYPTFKSRERLEPIKERFQYVRKFLRTWDNK
jgi:hypothetical protein